MNKKKILTSIVMAFLIVVCFVQGGYIYKLKQDAKKQETDPWMRMDTWASDVHKKMFSGDPLSLKEFDSFFDDKFFGQRFEPFGEIQGFPDRYSRLFGQKEDSLFNRSWKNWFGERMDVADINPHVKTEGDKVIVALKIPGVEGESVKVDLNQDRIRLSYNATVKEEKKSDSGGISHSEVSQQFEKVLPVPPEADSNTGRIEKKGEEIQIVFDKKKA